MAAGKSKIGRLLAERLGAGFVDSDTEIEAAFAMPIAEIFRTHGEREFRRVERDVVVRLIAEAPQVVALGGGAFVDPESRRVLNTAADTVWLDPSFDVIAERLGRSTSRPLASDRDREELRRMWEERRPCYAEAHFRVETKDDDARIAVDRIIERLGL